MERDPSLGLLIGHPGNGVPLSDTDYFGFEDIFQILALFFHVRPDNIKLAPVEPRTDRSGTYLDPLREVTAGLMGIDSKADGRNEYSGKP